MTTYNFGKRICKLLVESYREIFIGYVLGATDDLVKLCNISRTLPGLIYFNVHLFHMNL